MRVTRKTFAQAAANLFLLNWFSGDIHHSSLVSSAFFILAFLFDSLFICCVLKWKMYILIHIRLCGRVSDQKKFYPTDFWKHDYFFSAKGAMAGYDASAEYRKLMLKRVLPALRQSKRVHGKTQHHGACNSWKPRGEIVKLSVTLRA